MNSLKKSFYLSLGSFALSSMAIWFMPLGSFEQDGNQALSFALAGVFWVGIIAGFVFLWLISKKRNADKKYKHTGGVAFFRVFRNKPAKVFDVAFVVGLFALILCAFIHALPSWLTLIATFVSVFSLKMHGLFNGRNYEYLKSLEKTT